MSALDPFETRESITRLVGVCQRTGYFQSVNGFEPKSAPTSGGIAAGVWMQKATPIGPRSGGATVSLRVEYTIRLYQNMIKEPQDAIDPEMSVAAAAVMSIICGDFDLGSLVTAIDLLGAWGEGLEAIAGYLPIGGPQGQTLQRVMDIRVPAILDDVFAEVQ